MPFNPFSALTSKIFGGVAIALALALGIVMWRANAISHDREALRNSLAVERANHAVTRASLAALQGELEKMVKDGELRRSRLVEAQQEQSKRSEALREQAARIRAETGSEGCVTPAAVRGAKGL